MIIQPTPNLHSNILALAHLGLSLEAHGERMGLMALENNELLSDADPRV